MITTLFIIGLVLYFAMSFGLWKWNPRDWGADPRGVYLLGLGFITLVTLAVQFPDGPSTVTLF